MDENSNRDEYFDFIFQLEKELDLFGREIKDVKYWELIRSDVRKKITPCYGLNESNQDSLKFSKRRLLSILKSITTRNPFITASKDVLYFGDSRRQKFDNYYHEKCFEPALEELEYSYSIFEPIDYSYEGHREPQSTKANYTDFIDLISTTSSVLIAKFSIITGKEGRIVEKVERRLDEEFNSDLNLYSQVLRSIYRFKISKLLYRILLKITQPNIVVYAIGGSGALPEACKEEQIPVAEIQHGFIDENHHDYAFPENVSLSYAPDYFFIWGEKWKESSPFSGNVVLKVTGYPYIELFEEDNQSNIKDNAILIISQPIYKRELLDFAVKLSEETEYKVVYRLHPSEDKKDYSEIPDHLEIVKAEEKPLYSQFADVDSVLGVSSTALYEAVYFENFVYILDVSQATELNDLIDSNLAKKVTAPEDVQKNRLTSKIDSDYFFKSNPTRKIEKVLGRILN